jgi:glycosyltransferase involved in cell wall biosynthesis
MKISVLLPYKENFSPNYAGAVSLFVKDMTINSAYKNKTAIYGNTNYKNVLLSNYVNLTLNKKFYQSGSKLYVESFLKHELKNNSDLIEIHNRPNYIKFFPIHLKAKTILFFHNDPLSMNGSKTLKDRINLIKNLDQIIFNINWSKKRFFIGFDKIHIDIKKISVVYQSASKVRIDFTKKENTISFIGKLNSAKGYDLFGSSVIKILNKYPKWNALVVGDEPREKHFFKHKRLKILGFKNHSYVLNMLKKISISVVCSRWNEPFGRTSLEAASRGCALIISNKGGLPETTDHAIVLNKLSSNEIFNKIEFLIKNKAIRKKYQLSNYNNFKFTHKYISNILDKIRKNIVQKVFSPNFINGNKNNYKILHITNFNERHDGRLHYNTAKRINNGFIRLGHNVLSISDRDIIHKSKNFNDFNGSKALNNKIYETCKNFKPDIIVMGHTDAVKSSTLDFLKTKNKDLKITQWFLDPVSKNGPDFLKNKNRILDKSDVLDSNFLTTDPSSLNFKINNSFYMPNPCDQSFETLENFKNISQNDVFFAMSHGVHRGHLKRGKIDDREIFINKLMRKNKNLIFDIYGMKTIQPIWGDNFINKISNSNMGLNLSRGKPIKYYSSDRIAQLLGNGLLTFIDRRTCFNDFFKDNEVIFYDNINDLSEKMQKYKRDDDRRKIIARNGKLMYFKYFNSNIISDYIISKTFNFKSKNTFIWDK